MSSIRLAPLRWLLAAFCLQGCVGPAIAPPTPAVQGDDGTYAVYAVRPVAVDGAAAVAQAARFGVGGAAAVEEGDAFVVKAGARLVKLYKKTGITLYEDLDRMWGANGAVPAAEGAAPAPAATRAPVPGEAEAIQLAAAYLADHALLGGDEPAFFRSNETRQTTSAAGSQVAVIQREIVFRRKLDDRFLLGTACQASVFIGEGGAVNGVFMDWPALVEERRVAVMEQDVALGGLQARIDHLNGQVVDAQRVKRFVPRKTELSYIGYLNGDGSRSIVPTYAVVGTALINDRERPDYFVYLTASEASPVADTSNFVADPR